MKGFGKLIVILCITANEKACTDAFLARPNYIPLNQYAGFWDVSYKTALKLIKSCPSSKRGKSIHIDADEVEGRCLSMKRSSVLRRQAAIIARRARTAGSELESVNKMIEAKMSSWINREREKISFQKLNTTSISIVTYNTLGPLHGEGEKVNILYINLNLQMHIEIMITA